MDTPSAPSFSLNTKSWHETCRTAHFSVRPRRNHFSVPTAVRLRRRVERRSRMAAAWRPPEGLVLDGREHGGRLCHAGGERDHHPMELPASTSHVPLRRLGSGSGKAIKNRALGLIRKPDPSHLIMVRSVQTSDRNSIQPTTHSGQRRSPLDPQFRGGPRFNPLLTVCSDAPKNPDPPDS
jgi:hypothetical protein